MERRNKELNREALHVFLIVMSALLIGILPFCCNLAYTQQSQDTCEKVFEKWKDLTQNLQSKIKQFDSLQRAPARKIVGKPIVKRSSSKTIATQVAEALHAKEAVLSKKRDECRKLLGKEERVFTSVSKCLSKDMSLKKSELKRLERSRSNLIKKTLITIAEVKEVKGSEDYAFYYNPPRIGYNPMMGVQSNYWRKQQQMLMNYWRRWGR